jgi:hypothetical protein
MPLMNAVAAADQCTCAIHCEQPTCTGAHGSGSSHGVGQRQHRRDAVAMHEAQGDGGREAVAAPHSICHIHLRSAAMCQARLK